MKKKQSVPWWVWVVVVVIIIAAIAIFVVTFGTFTISDKSHLPQEFKDSKGRAIKKHLALKRELEKKTSLKLKLAKRFKIAYLISRVVIISTLSISIYFAGFALGANSLSDYMNFYELSIIILFAVNFIVFGTIANSHEFIQLLKTKVENWIWSKHINLPIEIEIMKQEIAILASQIATTENPMNLPAEIKIETETHNIHIHEVDDTINEKAHSIPIEQTPTPLETE